MKPNPVSEQEQRAQSARTRRPYEKPKIQRVDLALAETLSAGCKTVDRLCDSPQNPASTEIGS